MAEYTRDDEMNMSDIVAAARLAGMVPGTGRFSRAILGAGYRRTEAPSPDWELRGDFASQAASAPNPASERTWCGAPSEFGGQRPCPLTDPCDSRTCRLGSVVGSEVYMPVTALSPSEVKR